MREFRYLALGDSYTIGEAVRPELSFPYQLVSRFSEDVEVELTVIAKTGWTTSELMQAIAEQQLPGRFDLVTLLIGVNNQYRGYAIDEYQREFATLLHESVSFAGGDTGRVIVLSIPDWGVTPFALEDNRSPGEIARQIDDFNNINRREAEKAGTTYISITDGSRKAALDHELLADDGLHPSAKMYSQWVGALWPVVQRLI